MPADHVLFHERSWASYFKGYSHFAEDDNEAAGGWPSIVFGAWRWLLDCVPRAYASRWTNEVFENPMAWRDGVFKEFGEIVTQSPVESELRPHEAAHTRLFGSQFKPIKAKPRKDGSLGHEPIGTRDIMCSARHSVARETDVRGIATQYKAWVAVGKIVFVRD